MNGRKEVGLRRRVVLDDPPGDHRAEPLADVAFVQRCGFGYLFACRWWQSGHHVEQPGLVADARHQGEGAGIDDPDHRSRELPDLCHVEFLVCHACFLGCHAALLRLMWCTGSGRTVQGILLGPRSNSQMKNRVRYTGRRTSRQRPLLPGQEDQARHPELTMDENVKEALTRGGTIDITTVG